MLAANTPPGKANKPPPNMLAGESSGYGGGPAGRHRYQINAHPNIKCSNDANRVHVQFPHHHARALIQERHNKRTTGNDTNPEINASVDRVSHNTSDTKKLGNETRHTADDNIQ